MQRRPGRAGGDRHCPAIRHRLPRRQLLFHRSSDMACRRASCSPGRPGTRSRLCRQSQEVPRRRDSTRPPLSCPGVLSLSSRCRPPPCWPNERTSAFDSWMHGSVTADATRAQRESSPCLRRERATPWTARRWARMERPNGHCPAGHKRCRSRGAAHLSRPSHNPTRKGPAEDLTLQNLRPSPQRLSGSRPPWPAPCPRT